MKGFVIFVAFIILNALQIKAQTPNNLILNPGCEDPLVGGEIPNWTEVVGSSWTQASSSGPYDGNYYFYAGKVPSDGELRQDIDVSSLACTIDNGLQDFEFVGYVMSFDQTPPDETQIKIEYRNASNTTVLYTYDSGKNNNVVTWKKISSTTTAPAGTRWIRIRLISTYQTGGTSNDGYYDSLSLVATPVPIPTSPLELGNDTTLCQGKSLVLDATNPGATYLWSDNSTTPTLTVNSAGKYWVDLSINNCNYSDSINISYKAVPTVNLGNDTTLCQGQTAQLNLTGSGGITYQWPDNSNGSSFTITTAGMYWVDVTENQCTASDTINVSYTALPVFDLGNDTSLCENDLLKLNATTSGATYSWQNNSNSPTYTVNSTGKYWVDVSINGCSSSDTINVSYTALPSVGLGNDTIICNATPFTLNAATTGATYVWSDNSTASNLTVSTSGNYWVEITVNSCFDSDSISVTYNTPPNINIGNDTSICENSGLILNASINGATNYLWSDNSILPSLSINGAGTYWVNVTANNCTASDTINILELILSQVNIGDDKLICKNEPITLDATTADAIAYQWQDNSSGPTFSTSSSGTYQVNIATICGTITEEINIETVNCDCYVYLPNTFTPNKDERNDHFLPLYDCTFDEYEFSIYDRFGEKIFNTTDPTLAWYGDINSNDAPEGIYTWHLTYIGQGMPRRTLYSGYGKVLLLR